MQGAKDDKVYVAIEGGAYGNVPEAQVYEYYVIPVEPRKRKACGCGSCCCMSLLLFLLLFFFWPRTPSVWLNNVTLSTSDTETATGTFKFKNENYFGVKWSKPDISLYWMPSDGTTIGATCSGSTTDASAACEYLGGYSKQCAIKIGEFSDDDADFNTDSQEQTNEVLPLAQTSQQLACVVNMGLVAANQNLAQLLYSKGNVHAKSDYRNFGKVSIDGTYYY